MVPGATVESFHVSLFAVDAAFKYRGWSANAEYFWRSVTDLTSNLPVPSVGLQHGFYVEGGFFVLPQQFESNSQFAAVNGKLGSTTSFATGFSYYPLKSQNLKFDRRRDAHRREPRQQHRQRHPGRRLRCSASDAVASLILKSEPMPSQECCLLRAATAE